MKAIRFELKIKLLAERAPMLVRGMTCELCHCAPATDLHEIISRGHVPEQRRADLYVPELTALLCNKCNVEDADTTTARMQLFEQNIERYGREEVQAALDKLNGAMSSPIGIILPEGV